MQIKNRSPYGHLEVPLLRAVVEDGETLDVTEDQARALLPQKENWEPADDEARELADQLDHELDDVNTVGDLDGEMPSPAALRSVWVAWAKSRGDVDADSKTKKVLQAEAADAARTEDPPPRPAGGDGDDQGGQGGPDGGDQQ